MMSSNEQSKWVSPYLLRPLRSLEEVLAQRGETQRDSVAEVRPMPVRGARAVPPPSLVSLDEARMARRRVA